MSPDLVVHRPAPGQVVLEVSGEHDLVTRDALREALTALVSSHDLVVVDLSRATFIDSSVLSCLMAADRLARGRGSLVRLQLGSTDIVRKVLEISGLLDEIECVSDRDAALRLHPENGGSPRGSAPAGRARARAGRAPADP